MHCRRGSSRIRRRRRRNTATGQTTHRRRDSGRQRFADSAFNKEHTALRARLQRHPKEGCNRGAGESAGKGVTLYHAEQGHNDQAHHQGKEDQQARVMHGKVVVLFGSELVEIVIGHRFFLGQTGHESASERRHEQNSDETAASVSETYAAW